MIAAEISEKKKKRKEKRTCEDMSKIAESFGPNIEEL